MNNLMSGALGYLLHDTNRYGKTFTDCYFFYFFGFADLNGVWPVVLLQRVCCGWGSIYGLLLG